MPALLPILPRRLEGKSLDVLDLLVERGDQLHVPLGI